LESLDVVDRLLSKFKEVGALQMVSRTVHELIGRGELDPKFQCLAFLLVSQISEYLSDCNELRPVVTLLVEKSRSSYPLVRFAVFHALGQFAADQSPTFQNMFSESVLPALIVGAKDPIRRVCIHALKALSNTLAGCSIEHLTNYAHPLFDALNELLTTTSPRIYKRVLICIKSLAHCLGNEHFEPFGVKLVGPLLQNVEKIINKIDFQFLKLQGVIIHTVCTVFLYMPTQTIKSYSSDVVSALLAMQLKITLGDDVRWGYIYDSWAVLLKILAPVVEVVRDAILKLVMFGLEHSQDALNNVDPDKPQSQPVCSYDRMIRAIRLAGSLAINQKAKLLPHFDTLVNTVLNNLGNLVDEQLRLICATTLPIFIESLQLSSIEPIEGRDPKEASQSLTLSPEPVQKLVILSLKTYLFTSTIELQGKMIYKKLEQLSHILAVSKGEYISEEDIYSAYRVMLQLLSKTKLKTIPSDLSLRVVFC
jgi:hypothetical protein